jgi:TrmH family RNA methyltransferase
MEIINSLNNLKIKETVRLRKSGVRCEQGLMIIDGKREILAAIKAKVEIIRLFYCPELIKEEKGTLADLIGVSPDKVMETSRPAFLKICYKENPDGFLAVAKQPHLPLSRVKVTHQPLVVVLEAVEKPGNLGAIIRSSYAAGVDAIVINDNQTDIYNPNTIRASEGLIFNQTLAIATVEETVDWLKAHGIKSFAAATSAKQDYWQADLKSGAALVFGSEAEGLTRKWLKAADQSLKIPMRQGVDSLNVSVSAALLIFEVKRQRRR